MSMAIKISERGDSAPSGSLPNRRPRVSSWLATVWFVMQCLIALPLLPFLLIGEAACAPFSCRRHDHWLMWVLSKFGPGLIAGGLIGLAIGCLKRP